MDFMFDWEAEGDRFSFEDSDRFEEDSLCSWISEPESLCNNWRGWRKQNGGPPALSLQSCYVTRSHDGTVTSLVELTAQAVACHIPFEVVEHFYPPIPEQLQLRIAFWSFPENEEDIRLYSCLANGSADEFQRGEHLFKTKAVKDALQIGFHLSATVVPPQPLAQAKGSFNVAVVFDRRRITSCNCTCSSAASWCSHVVALCLFRIHLAPSVCLRAPVSESLSRLHRDQLQKFAQYLISELPQQILPTAQRLLDELLSSQQTAINTVCGAPDPTAGPSASEQTTWCLDEGTLHENIKKTLIKFCVPSPIVFSDVNYLSSTAPPAAAEWQSLLRPLRGREPEGIWNLLSIVREMYRRNDTNAFPLLEILTEEILACEQILLWWFTTKVSASHNWANNHSGRGNQNSSSSSQHAAASMCDEIVTLWRLSALNPSLSPIQLDDLTQQLKDWHIKTIDKVRKARTSMPGGNTAIKKADIEVFSGFKNAIEACQLDWRDYPIPFVTYVERDRPRWKFSFSKGQDGENRRMQRGKGMTVSQTSGAPRSAMDAALVQCRRQLSQEQNTSDLEPGMVNQDGACSSSSEGFCENDRLDGPSAAHDSDSDLGEGGEASLGPNQVAKLKSKVAHLSLKDREEADFAFGLPGPSGYNPGNKEGEMEEAAAAAFPIDQVAPEHLQQAGADEYQVYFFDPKAKENVGEKKKKSDEPNYFAGIRKLENKQDILFARAEGLHAHGHTREACKLAKHLAEEMLTNPPDLTPESAPVPAKGKKKKAQNNISSFASTTLAKAAFLCSVLLEDPECHHLAFQVGMFGLEMPRPPAVSKALEVKLAHQESELASLLKRIPLGLGELNVIRDRAERLRDGKLKSRGDALLPLTLSSFIFDSLCLTVMPVSGGNSRPPSRSIQHINRSPADEKLGFEAAVAALGLKANVSEADHPLLCEGTRRQRGDLAITMLVHYKDDQLKLSKIMDKLLDKEVHQLYKAPSLTTYLTGAQQAAAQQGRMLAASMAATASGSHAAAKGAHEPPSDSKHHNGTKESSSGAAAAREVSADKNSHGPSEMVQTTSAGDILVSGWDSCEWKAAGKADCANSHSLDYLNLEQNLAHSLQPVMAGARPKTRQHSKEKDLAALDEDCGSPKDWELKLRCTNLKGGKKHLTKSQGMAAVDSSAPETTSSDNSPTLIRRNWAKHQGPGSDSGSSGKSSDSLGSSSSGDKGASVKIRDNDSPLGVYAGMRFAPHMIVDSRASTPNIKATRYKGKNRAMPTVPNQPSEASAHFMFELAKTVLTKAGGTSSTSLFTQPTSTNNHTGPHRNLHLCAFQIGLYALGLHNCVSPNWLSRTYSSHVSWITGQAMEIGSAAINILIDTWEGHLTPPEVASLADRASRGRDPNMVRAAAELALSCLPHAHALNPNEIQRALIQCKEQSRDMLERACLAVESSAKGGGVYPEVLYDVAHRWHDLYEESMQGPSARRNQVQPTRNVQQQEVSQPMVPLAAAQPIVVENNNAALVQLVPCQQIPQTNAAAVGAQAAAQAGQAGQANGQVAAAVAIPTLSYALPPPPGHSHPQMSHHPYIAPYSYVQQIQPNFSHHYSQPHIPLHTHNMHPSYMATYPYQSQTFANMPHIQNLPHNATLYHANVSHLRPPPPAVQVSYNGQTAQMTMQPARGVMQNKFNIVQGMDQQGQAVTQTVVVSTQANSQVTAAVSNTSAQHPQQPQQEMPAQNSTQMNYLLSAYRVGMLAMETLARRVHDDRPQTKYARNPPYGEDVKWLLAISMKLDRHVSGTNYLQQFCAATVNAVVSPFILHDIAIEAAHYLARNNPAQVQTQLRSPILNSLIQKCLQMFIQCSHQRMHHITQTEYDEFVGIVCSARNAFYMTPGGMVQFNELLQSLRRSKSCKKELWQRIMNTLTSGNI